MAVDTNYQVLYVNGDIPTTPIRLGQLIVDGGVLKICTSLSPLTYTDVGGGGGATPRGATFVSTTPIAVPVNDVPLYFPNAATILGVSVLTLGGTGSCVLDIRKRPFGTYPPTGADSICAAAKPTIVSGIKYLDTTLSGWTTTVDAGDVLLFVLESSSTFRTIVIQLNLGA